MVCYRLFAMMCMGVYLAVAAGADEPTVSEPTPTVNWREDLKQATEEVTKQQRPLLLVFTMERCGYCQLMKRTTYNDEQVISSINDNFVPIQICGQ